MSFTKTIVNAINNALKPHELTVKRVQALFLWIDPKCSIIFFILLESLFIFAYLLPFSWSCNLCLVIGFFVLCYCLYSSFPHFFDKILSFIKTDVDEKAPNRIREVPEVSAFLTTAISFWTSIIRDVFKSASSDSLYDAIFAILIMLAFFIFSFFVGDFLLVWLIFHFIFVFPPIFLLPIVQKWLTENPEAGGGHHFSTGSITPTNSKKPENSPDGSEDPPAALNQEKPKAD